MNLAQPVYRRRKLQSLVSIKIIINVLSKETYLFLLLYFKEYLEDPISLRVPLRLKLTYSRTQGGKCQETHVWFS